MPDEHLKKIHDKDAADHEPTSVFDDLKGLRKAQEIKVVRETVLVDVKVGKPPSNAHFRAHPSSDWHLDNASIVVDRKEGTTYFVHPCMREYPKLKRLIRYVTLATICLWPGNILQIWPVPALGSLKRDIQGWKAQRAAYDLSFDKWVQMVWDADRSDYAVETAENIAVDPTWPTDKTFNDLLKLGFDGITIDGEDHSYVRQLRGLDT